MLERIVKLSLRYRLLVIIACLGIVATGVRAFYDVPVDAFPDVTPVQVNIYTETPGLAAEDVEKLITFPVESAMAGLPGVQEIRSVSLFGLSYVTVYFQDDVDIYFARRLAAERLSEAKASIPEGYGEPTMGPNSSGLGWVFWWTLEGKDRNLNVTDLRTEQEWTVRLILRTAPGVDDITSFGGHERRYQVLIDPRKLIKHNLGFKAVMEMITANNRQVGGQYVDLGSEQYLVRGLGLVTNVNDIGNIVIAKHEGTSIHLRDVAEVTQGPSPRFGAVTKDGKEVVLGMALQRIGENAKRVVDGVKDKIRIVNQALPSGVFLNPVYDRTELVQRAVWTAQKALIEGAILVVVVLFLFLGDARSALVVIVTLPLAMLISYILMQEFGLSANLMSLAGLAVGVGMMIDGAVVVVENSFRHLGGEDAASVPRSQVMFRAASEVANPVAFAIVIIVVVFLPLFSLSGLEGKLFKPMALTITFAMLGSLVLSLTLVPVLASFFLRVAEERDTWLVRMSKRLYVPLLDRTLEHKGMVAAGAVALLAAAAALFPVLGKEFMPRLEEGAIMFRVTSIPSTSLDESIVVSQIVDKKLKEFPQTASTIAMIGRAEKGDAADVNYMEILVNLKPPEQWSTHIPFRTLQSKMQESLEQALPASVVSSTQPIQMRVEELISGVRATLVLKLYGPDLRTLDKLSTRIQSTLAHITGVKELSLEANRGKPQMVIQVKRAEAARYGINVSDILEIVRAGIGGAAVSSVIDGVKRFDIQVWLAPQFRNSVESIENIPIRTEDGSFIPLAQVASVDLKEGYSFVRREQLQRYAVVQMDVAGRDIDGFVKEASEKLKREVKLPSGYWTQWGGAFENQRRAMGRLAVIVPVTIGLIFILLYTAFNSLTHATLIISNVPFATIGGVFALFFTRQYLSVPSAIGFIAVFGVAMLNGIVLISVINDLRRQGLALRDAVRQGTILRLRPVLITASVAVLGLIPMLLSTGVGAETQRPLATVVVGGLFTSTALTLLLLPLMYEWVEGRKGEKSARE